MRDSLYTLSSLIGSLNIVYPLSQNTEKNTLTTKEQNVYRAIRLHSDAPCRVAALLIVPAFCDKRVGWRPKAPRAFRRVAAIASRRDHRRPLTLVAGGVRLGCGFLLPRWPCAGAPKRVDDGGRRHQRTAPHKLQAGSKVEEHDGEEGAQDDTARGREVLEDVVAVLDHRRHDEAARRVEEDEGEQRRVEA
jgi:hypothetical protein